jgi:uncharacterized protein (TIGR02466 family)|tara:strand:- start:43 stop:717 length:675 start_codon:yes stop_codon:yes gene_type:complete
LFKYQITPAFSTPIVSVNIGQIDVMTLAWVKNLTYPTQGVACTGNDDHLPINERGFDIINAPPLTSLKKKIKEAVDYYAYTILDVDTSTNFAFTSSWINRLEKHEDIPKHIHKNSIISGVYYIDVTPNSAPITLHKNITHLNTWPASTTPASAGVNWNQFNTDAYTFNPVNGLAILFPSHLEHSVAASNEDTYRYGLAFNMFATGTLIGDAGPASRCTITGVTL